MSEKGPSQPPQEEDFQLPPVNPNAPGGSAETQQALTEGYRGGL